jgi:hypothetical protein
MSDLAPFLPALLHTLALSRQDEQQYQHHVYRDED